MGKVRTGNEEAWALFEDAWYTAFDRLGQIIQTGDDAQAIAASRTVLEFASTFTQLGPPFLPDSDRPEDLDWDPND